MRVGSSRHSATPKDEALEPTKVQLAVEVNQRLTGTTAAEKAAVVAFFDRHLAGVTLTEAARAKLADFQEGALHAKQQESHEVTILFDDGDCIMTELHAVSTKAVSSEIHFTVALATVRATVPPLVTVVDHFKKTKNWVGKCKSHRWQTREKRGITAAEVKVVMGLMSAKLQTLTDGVA
jgi:hypothetical protein